MLICPSEVQLKLWKSQKLILNICRDIGQDLGDCNTDETFSVLIKLVSAETFLAKRDFAIQ